jgi:hypothetical protein
MLLLLLHGGLRSIVCVAWFRACSRYASLGGAEEVGILDRSCPCFVSACGANDGHDEDDNGVNHDCEGGDV